MAKHRNVNAFVAEIPRWTDDILIAAAVIGGAVQRRGPDAAIVDRAMRSELERRGLTGQVDHLIAAGKELANQMAAESVTTHLPDGSAMLRMRD